MPNALDANEVIERWKALRAPGAFAALEAACRAEVVEEVWRAPGSVDHLPGPYVPQRHGRTPARTQAGPPGVRVGLDAQGRAVIADEHGGAWNLLRWADDGRSVEVVTPPRREVEAYALDGAGRAIGMVEVQGREEPYVGTNYYAYDAGRPAQAIHLFRSHEVPGAWSATTSWFAHGPDGELALVEHLTGAPPLAPGRDEAAALAAALALSPADYEGRRTTWDARRLARVDDLPAPEAALDGLAEPLARALLAAAEAAVEDLAFVAVDLLPWRSGDDAPLLRAAAIGATDRDRIRRAGEPGAAAMLDLAHAVAHGASELDAFTLGDDDLARRVRAAIQAFAGGDGDVRAKRVAAFAPQLAKALGDRGVVRPEPESAPLGSPALATLTPLPREGAVTAGVARLLDEAGLERIDDALTEPYHYAHCDLRVPDRDVLRELLAAVGLTGEEAATVAGDARWALVLEDAPGGDARSWVGGLPVLPAEAGWPTADGRALTHLATLALDELPDVEGSDALPADGHLAFFADLSDAAELYEPIAPGGRRELIRILHAPTGTPTHTPAPVDASVLLKERRVRAEARLQLRFVGFGFARRLWEIDGLGERTIERLRPAVNGRPTHQLLGWPTTVQEDPRDARDDEVLLHVVPDHTIGFSFMDAGDLLFFGPRAALCAGDWDQVTAWPGSC